MVAGDPALLRSFTDELSAVVPALRTAADDCSTAIVAYNDAPNDLPDADLTDVGAAYAVDAETLAELAAIPAAFATLVEAADGDGALLTRLDQLLLDTWVATPTFADAEALLAALTGTPAELADDLRALLAEGSELSPGEVDDVIASYRALMGETYLQVGQTYGDVLITEENRAGILWQVLGGMGNHEVLPPDLIERLLDVSARTAVGADDPEFTAALFEDLGPEDTARLPTLVAGAAWSDAYTTGGEGFDAPAAMAPFSEALGTASPALPDAFWDDLFARATTSESVEDPNLGWWGDDTAEVVDDAFPALFVAGTFTPDVATRAGQLGIDILNGQQADGTLVHVRRGMGSPLYDGFDDMATHWEDRGAMLVEAASRTPQAATDLLGDDRNAAVLTDNDFGRDEGEAGTEHVPDWGVVGDEVGSLVEAGTIENLAVDPDGTREAAANVINAAIDENPGDAHEALATTYAKVGTQYMGDFAVDNYYGNEAAADDDHLSIGSYPAAQFVALGMASEEGREMLASAHEVLALDIVVTGVEAEADGQLSDWEQRLGKLDAVVLSAELGDSFDSAEDAQSAALEYNARLASGQGALLRAVGLAPHTKVVSVGLAPLADHIRTEYLEQATNQVEIAESEANGTVATAYDVEDRLVVTGHLVSALRAEAAGTADADQQAVLRVAEAEMSAESLEALRGVAGGGSDPALLEAVDQARLTEDLDALREGFAGHSELPVEDGWGLVSDYHQRHLTRFPAGLFVEE